MRRAIVLLVVLSLVLTGEAWGFHEQGAENCGSCHTWDSSPGSDTPDAPMRHPYMLKEATPSDVCLKCHATELGAVFSSDVMNPAPEKGAGNFIFLLEDNLNDGSDGADSMNWIPGDAAGHNLHAPGNGLYSDQILSVAPGGMFTSGDLGCSSCHDPHGNPSFRMLHGAGPVQAGLFTFTNPAPVAEGISVFIGSEAPDNHTVYKSGMSEWCANCHTDFHNTNYPTVMKHSSGASIGAAVASMYNSYNGTTDKTGGMYGDAYLPEVPFEDDDPSRTISSSAGARSSSKVMCLSCHRAHASSSPDAGRWDFNLTLLSEDGERSGSFAQPNPYGSGQRSLCNKCHGKDKNDAMVAMAR